MKLPRSKHKFKKLSNDILSWCPHYMGLPRGKNYLPNLKISRINNVVWSDYDPSDDTIRVYYNQIKSVNHLVRMIIHEYTHYVQLPSDRQDRLYSKYEKEVGYWDNPFEVEARNNEKKYVNHIYYRIKSKKL